MTPKELADALCDRSRLRLEDGTLYAEVDTVLLSDAAQALRALEEVRTVLSNRARSAVAAAIAAEDEFGTPAHLAAACKAWTEATSIVSDRLDAALARAGGGK